jgi:Domain of Unknown Function with PDB structure (DUF3857)
MKHIILLLIGLYTTVLYAQSLPSYDVATIPDSLKTNANSIVRFANIDLQVGDVGKATLVTKKVVTVLNKEGDDALTFVDYEDGFRKLKDASIVVYNAKGDIVSKYGKKQLERVRNSDGFSLVNDGKLFYFTVPANEYPITVAFESEVQMKGFLDFDDLQIVRAEQATQDLYYTIKTPSTNPIKYKNFGCNLMPLIKTEGKWTTYYWMVKNQKAIKTEKNSSYRNALPRVAITPTYFEMDGYPGEFSSWQTYGNWYYTLCNKTNDIEDKDKAYITTLVAEGATVKEKIKILYTYLQQNYRYVSIQLGIGGFKPFVTSFVNKNKYGDCKALSNYMQSMLQVAGIESYQALINAGSKQLPVDDSFPNHSFNHVIVCVPNGGDTVWLECTSATARFGVLGGFTENRNALLVTPNGGKLVTTPKSNYADNYIHTRNVISIQDDFSANAVFNFAHSGSFYDMYVSELWEQSQQTQNEFLLERVGLKPYDKFTVEQNKYDYYGTTKMDIQYNKIYEFNAGSKYFIKPHLFTVWQTSMPTNNERVTDYFFSFPFLETDTSIYVLPKGFTMDNQPKKNSFTCNNASYTNETVYDKTTNTISVITQLALKQHRIPPSQYQETKAFFDKVITECGQKIVVRRE